MSRSLADRSVPTGSQVTATRRSHAGRVNSTAFPERGYVAPGSAIAKASGASQGIGILNSGQCVAPASAKPESNVQRLNCDHEHEKQDNDRISQWKHRNTRISKHSGRRSKQRTLGPSPGYCHPCASLGACRWV